MISNSERPVQDSFRVHRSEGEIRERLLRKLGIFVQGQSVSPLLAFPQQLVKGPCSRARYRQMDMEKFDDRCVSSASLWNQPVKTDKPSEGMTVLDNYWNSSKQEYLSLLDMSTESRQPIKLQSIEHYRPKASIQFKQDVSVVEIPSRREYPKPLRRQLWTNCKELRMNGERNALEFAADYYDWRYCREEDVFIAVNGVLYHPETYRRRFSWLNHSNNKQKRKNAQNKMPKSDNQK